MSNSHSYRTFVIVFVLLWDLSLSFALLLLSVYDDKRVENVHYIQFDLFEEFLINIRVLSTSATANGIAQLDRV